jgi:DNA recombination protein RmuC
MSNLPIFLAFLLVGGVGVVLGWLLGSRASGDLAHAKIRGELVRPIEDTLKRLEAQVEGAEKSRIHAQGELREQLRRLSEDGARIQRETSRLVDALRKPQGRGRWGELQLRRVVEMAGMVEYCDFEEQMHLRGEGGAILRPDLVVRLPGDKQIVVDAKVPAEAYLQALEAEDEAQRKAALRRHADQVRQHIRALGDRAYWNQFPEAPDFVVLFLPGDPFLSAALEADPGLFDESLSRRILLVGPTTLVALLKAAAYGWQQAGLSQRAEEIRTLGQELYARLVVLSGHFQKLGRELHSAVDAYDRAVGSLESRVLVSGRRMGELGVGTTDPIPELNPLGRVPRRLHAEGEDQPRSERP